MKAILAINSGSSSLKFRLASVDGESLLSGTATRLGTDGGAIQWQVGEVHNDEALAYADHGDILRAVAVRIDAEQGDTEVAAVGHRIVHGGTTFGDPVIIEGDVLDQIRALEPLAPLHQPAGIEGIELATKSFPLATQVAVFDTAFHLNKPWLHDAYALDARHYDDGIRRYGFHGISCQSVMRQLDADKQSKRVIIAHLGNGCSVTAVNNGRPQATSMGFSTLDGVTMGTRPGHLDAGVILHWLRIGRTCNEIERELYHASGLIGLSGVSNDVRDLLASSDPRAASAIDFFNVRIAEEIARMATSMRGFDAIVFCGGIGENAATIRDAIIDQIGFLAPSGNIAAHVVPTDEEGEIILRTQALI